jgi:hypothetical protein
MTVDVDLDSLNRNSSWTTRDGLRIAIKDMADSHLLNAIRVLRRKSPIGTTLRAKPSHRRKWLNALANEAYFRRLHLDDLSDDEPIHE